jgi:hypothetical protein
MIEFENSLGIITDILGCSKSGNPKWFVGFGALLYLIRDHKQCINFNQDIDICYFGDDYESVRESICKELTPIHRIIDDRNNNNSGSIMYR